VSAGEPCPDCGGKTIEFRGSGLNVEYRVCPRWKQPGHKKKAEVLREIEAKRAAHAPASGRTA
jgi:hypothetical protein